MPSVPKPKRARTKHYFAEWREFRGLTQARRLGRGWGVEGTPGEHNIKFHHDGPS